MRAWETARWLAKNNADVNFKVFGMHFTTEIFQNISASECIEKIRQYEQERDTTAELEDVIVTTCRECGVTLDDIASVLQKMKREGCKTKPITENIGEIKCNGVIGMWCNNCGYCTKFKDDCIECIAPDIDGVPVVGKVKIANE